LEISFHTICVVVLCELISLRILLDKSLIDTDFVLVQTPVNQTNSTEPITYARHCAGVSPYTLWIAYIGGGIYMQINTTNCKFNITPLYYTSIIGNTIHTDFTGYDAIYGASKTSFTIYVRSYSGWTNAQMVNSSQIDKWNLSWVGIYY